MKKALQGFWLRIIGKTQEGRVSLRRSPLIERMPSTSSPLTSNSTRQYAISAVCGFGQIEG